MRRQFLLNLICFAGCIEGLFFFGACAYVYFLRSRGLLDGVAAVTNWVFRDQSAHMAFAFEVVDTLRREELGLFVEDLARSVVAMLEELPRTDARPGRRSPRCQSASRRPRCRNLTRRRVSSCRRRLRAHGAVVAPGTWLSPGRNRWRASVGATPPPRSDCARLFGREGSAIGSTLRRPSGARTSSSLGIGWRCSLTDASGTDARITMSFLEPVGSSGERSC